MSVALALGVVALSAGTRGAAEGEDKEVVRWGRLGILNNQWGAALGHADPASYQRVRVDGSRVVFEFDWRNRTPDDRYWVKAFPSIVAGWHYGVPVYPGDATLGRLPLQLSRRPALRTSLRATRTGANESDVMNLAWDIWLTASKPDPEATEPVAPAAEVMVWPWRQQQGPLTLDGSTSKACARVPVAAPVAVTDGGRGAIWDRAWDVYLGCGTNGTAVWPVLSFIPREPMTAGDGVVEASGRLGDFLSWLQGHATAWTTWQQDWWVAGVEFGSEIIQGRGAWTIDTYRIEP